MFLQSNYKKWFLNYVDSYGKEPEIILKRDHSLRVADNMKYIFQQLKMPNDYISLADFIGLFHDIGRFEQWRNYKTFNDNKSVDHADFSAHNLLYEGILKNILIERCYDSLIYDAIKYHNKLFLPKEFTLKNEQLFKMIPNLKNTLDLASSRLEESSAITSLYVMAIRDADKIDILHQYFVSQYFLKTDYLPVSDKVASDFFENKPIDKKYRKNLNDVLILRLAFLNDINLTRSLIMIRDRRILNKMQEAYPDKVHLNEYFRYAEERLNSLIDKNKDYEYVLKK